MTAREVMRHPAFVSKHRTLNAYVIRLFFPDISNYFGQFIKISGHTWKEAFRKAAIAITTNRLFGATR